MLCDRLVERLGGLLVAAIPWSQLPLVLAQEEHDPASSADNEMRDRLTEHGWLESFLIWASKEPLDFLFYVLVFLSPFFCLSAYLSWKLCKEIEAKEAKRKRKAKKE
uniref:Small integral membrane protein 15 n=1 Tax=Pseudodiaptomus poplesia TaxID=213370 RepID=A0A0U2UPR3_9MAXI|nr:small integral membrane protein 15 [Pseudodiaptomus poplesia]